MEYNEIAAKRRKKRKKSCFYAPFALFRGYSVLPVRRLWHQGAGCELCLTFLGREAGPFAGQTEATVNKNANLFRAFTRLRVL